ncbi:hypothetical protein Aduo_009266 [Ancylostoma duodenale]
MTRNAYAPQNSEKALTAGTEDMTTARAMRKDNGFSNFRRCRTSLSVTHSSERGNQTWSPSRLADEKHKLVSGCCGDEIVKS